MEARAHAVLAVLLLLAAQVTMATGETRCNPGEYEVTSLRRCSKLCPAGYYVSKYIDQDHSVGECRKCESGTFRAHPNEESSCVPCSQCREDQEVVTECFPTSDRLCQCKQGHFYCDSTDCTESCFRCKRCEDSTILQPCNATRDTVCAVKIHPEAGGSACVLAGPQGWEAAGPTRHSPLVLDLKPPALSAELGQAPPGFIGTSNE
nr:tumor necrosis factor receptor superfamily member 26-like [Globicephala melas]